MSLDKLEAVASDAAKYCEQLELIDPAKPDKHRIVLNVTGSLRELQSRLLKSILLPALKPSQYSHGGIVGRHIKTNVEPHLSSVFAFTSDISNFYPSIHHRRVYELFCSVLKCSPDVSRLCTMLTTWHHHLALGLITSPMIADQILRPVDERIAGACKDMELVYTRFVDDISISGTFDLAPKRCGIAGMIERIMDEHGFEIQRSKHKWGRLDGDIALSKLRLRRGKIDVRAEYAAELDRQLTDAAALAQGGTFEGPFYMESQIRGRIFFVKWINKGRWGHYLERFRAIDWNKHFYNGRQRKLVIARKRVVPIRAM